ncbi:MAG: HDIG domain-containing metalloprotein [Bacteroidota bacterium]
MINYHARKILNILLSEKTPSKKLNSLSNKDIAAFCSQLIELKETGQDPKWHPEGNVWTHTMMVVDVAAELKNELPKEDHPSYMLGALLHDIGKPATSEYSDGRIKSPGHDHQGAIIAGECLRKNGFDEDTINEVTAYVREHLRPIALYRDRNKVSDNAINKLGKRINIDKLILLAKADHWGRDKDEAFRREYPAGDWLKSRIEHNALMKKQPKPFLKGKFLKNHGVEDGPEIGRLINESLKLQKEGRISSVRDAKKWAKERIEQERSK